MKATLNRVVSVHVILVLAPIRNTSSDQIAVNLRVVNVSTGEILSSVNTSKTILSYEVQAGVFRFIDYQRLLEGEIGYTLTNRLCFV